MVTDGILIFTRRLGRLRASDPCGVATGIALVRAVEIGGGGVRMVTAMEEQLTTSATIVPDGKASVTPGCPLYPLFGVALASFLGSPLAGGWVIAANFRRAGDRGRAKWALLWGLLTTVFLVTVAILLPRSMPRSWLVVPGVVCMYHLARLRQGDIINRHVEAGGATESWLKAIGIGVLGMVVLLTPLLAWNVHRDPPWKNVAISANEVVKCRGEATAADARLLGEKLTNLGLFGTSTPKTVILDKATDRYTVSVIVEREKGKEPNAKLFAGVVVTHVKALFRAKAVVVRLVDPELQVEAEVSAE